MTTNLCLNLGRFVGSTSLALAIALGGVPVASEEIVFAHYGQLMTGAPIAVALERGEFKRAGIDITGVITSKGGGTTLRNVVASATPYADSDSLGSAILAFQEGFDLRIINCSITGADVVWVTMPTSSLKTLKDLQGKKVGITSPKGGVDMLIQMALNQNSIPIDQVKRIALGGIGAGLVALEQGGVDAVPVLEPLFSAKADKYRIIGAAAKDAPPVYQGVGITTGEYAKKNPDKLRAILAGRRAAVDFIYANPDEAAVLIAKNFGDSLSVDVSKKAVKNLTAARYWSEGNCKPELLNNMVQGMKAVGLLTKDVDLKAIVDWSFLPNDLRS